MKWCVFGTTYAQTRVNDCGNTSLHQTPACHYNLLTENDRRQAGHVTRISFKRGKRKKRQTRGRTFVSKCISCVFVSVHMNSEVKGQCNATVGVRVIQRRRRAYGAETDPRGALSSLASSQLSLTVREQSLPIGHQQQQTQHTSSAVSFNFLSYHMKMSFGLTDLKL